jgi:hypothetical protein
VCIPSLFIFVAAGYPILLHEYTTVCFFIHQWKDNFFQFWVIRIIAALNTYM